MNSAQIQSVVHQHATVAFPPAPIDFDAAGIARHAFMASLLPGVLPHKVANFVAYEDAKARKLTDTKIELRLGQKRLGLASYTASDLPVDVTISIDHEKPCAREMTHVAIEIRARSGASADLFKRRCASIVRTLHACFLAHPLELTG